MKTFKEYLSEKMNTSGFLPIRGAMPAFGAAIPAQKQAQRRRYSHDHSADKVWYLDYKKDGTPYWRKKSAESIVFYGKQQLKTKDDREENE